MLDEAAQKERQGRGSRGEIERFRVRQETQLVLSLVLPLIL